MYIGEIEKANNFLKLQVCQCFEAMHVNDKVKFEFVDKINNMENKPYFHRKLNLLDVGMGLPELHSASKNEDAKTDFMSDKKQVKEVRFAAETEKLIRSYNFFDEISSSCTDKLQPNDELRKTRQLYQQSAQYKIRRDYQQYQPRGYPDQPMMGYLRSNYHKS